MATLNCLTHSSNSGRKDKEGSREQCTCKYTYALGLYIKYHGNQDANSQTIRKIKHRSTLPRDMHESVSLLILNGDPVSL